MNTPIKITSLEEYINQIKDITDPDVNYIYRGQENAEWLIRSSGYRRVLKEQPNADPYSLTELFIDYLIPFLNNYIPFATFVK